MESRHPQTHRSPFVVAAALLALFVPAGAVSAQVTSSFARADGGGPRVDVARAVALEAQASELCVCFDNCLQIARLFEEAASLRPEGDPQRALDHELAGRMYHHLGKLRQAQELTVAAAEAYLAMGDVVNAAHQFINAATVAQERKRHEEAAKLVQRAECLTRSPLLTRAEAELIRERIQPTGRILVVRRTP